MYNVTISNPQNEFQNIYATQSLNLLLARETLPILEKIKNFDLDKLVTTTFLHRHKLVEDEHIIVWRNTPEGFVSTVASKTIADSFTPVSWANTKNGIEIYEFIDINPNNPSVDFIFQESFEQKIDSIFGLISANQLDGKCGLSVLQKLVLLKKSSLAEVDWKMLEERDWNDGSVLIEMDSEERNYLRQDRVDTSWAWSTNKAMPITTCIVAAH